MKTKKYIYLSIVLLFAVSCSINKNNGTQNNINNNIAGDSITLIFQDSLTIGEKKQVYKIDVTQTFRPNDDRESLLKINLFEKSRKQWTLVQNLVDTVFDISDPEIELINLNNHGLMDLSFKSALAAQGYNEIRKHYILDKETNRFFYLKNSQEYPNLTYNENLDCLMSMVTFGGGYATIFLELKGEYLLQFAIIELFNNQRTVRVRNKYGNENTIDKIPYDLNEGELTYGDYDYKLLKQYKSK